VPAAGSARRVSTKIRAKQTTAFSNTENVSKDAPLRLDTAAEMAFPDGSMSASGLRREAAKGHLIVERIAGKDYTTLAAVEEMRRLCRIEQKVSDCGSEKVTEKSPQRGLSVMALNKCALDAALTTAKKLKQSSQGT
jgi:hypothetical protein